jgi:hypothetical protein
MRGLCALLLVAVVKIYAPPKSIMFIRTFHVLASHALSSPSVQKTRISSCVRKDKRKKKTVSTTNTTVAPHRTLNYSHQFASAKGKTKHEPSHPNAVSQIQDNACKKCF